ncbi:MAG: sulfotransferase family 2 domain-containing protein [Acidimicrobiales bacterium]
MPPVFFLHIMKTAGTSVTQLLRTVYHPDEVYPEASNVNEKTGINRLITLEPKRRSQLRLYSVHMPAWVADTVGTEFVRATVLREPVERTISHLAHIARALDMSIEDIYADENWRNRLANYQTRILTLRRAVFEASQAAWETRLRELAATGVTAPPSDDLAKQHRNEIRHQYSALTVMPEAEPLAEADLERAMAVVDGFDVVGLTSELESFQHRLSAHMGLELPPIPVRNRAPHQHDLSDSLRTSVEQDQQLDLQLFEHVRRTLTT